MGKWIEKIENDLEEWHKVKNEQCNEEEANLCKQMESLREPNERKRACTQLGDAGVRDGLPSSISMLRTMSICTLERVVKKDADNDVKEAACEALGKLAAHRRPSTTSEVLRFAQSAPGYGHKVAQAAGSA